MKLSPVFQTTFVLLLITFFSFVSAQAQNTAFTYQGRLTDGALAANGTYQMQFALFDAGGTQTGPTLTFNGISPNPAAVPVANSIFTVELDFGNQFPGADRFLEIRVKKNAEPVYTVLGPRQRLDSVPYAVRSVSAAAADTATTATTSTTAVTATTATSVDLTAGNSVVAAINASAATVNTANVSGDVELAPATEQTTTSTNTLLNLRLNGFGTLGTSGVNDFLSFKANGNYSTGALNKEWFRFDNAGGFFALGTWDGLNDIVGTGTIPLTGDGTRLMWHPAKGAFRAGYTSGGNWDDALIGNGSFAVGSGNRASGRTSFVFGNDNITSGESSGAFGALNNVSGRNSYAFGSSNTVAGNNNLVNGSSNTMTSSATSGAFAFGLLNTVGSQMGFAIGERATVNSSRAMVISLGPSFGVATNDAGSNTLTVRAANGIYFGTNTGSPTITSGHFIETSTGAFLSSGGTWTNASSRDLKDNFEPVDPRSILRKVLSLPIQTWNYKAENGSVRHIGAISQDFYGAFNFGDSERSIATVDADGVALAAIQGLNEELKDRDKKIEEQQKQLNDLQQQVKQQQTLLEGMKKMLCADKPDADVCRQ